MEWTSLKVRGLAEQVLTEQEHRIYRYHLLLGADLKLCCQKLGLDVDTLRGIVTEIRRKLEDALFKQSFAPVVAIDDYVNRVFQPKTWGLKLTPVVGFAV